MAESGGFEPPWELVTPKSISSRSRYDHFGNSPIILTSLFDRDVEGQRPYRCYLAERAGFEPAVHLCGHTHDFQSCSFGHSDISPQLIQLPTRLLPSFL